MLAPLFQTPLLTAFQTQTSDEPLAPKPFIKNEFRRYLETSCGALSSYIPFTSRNASLVDKVLYIASNDHRRRAIQWRKGVFATKLKCLAHGCEGTMTREHFPHLITDCEWYDRKGQLTRERKEYLRRQTEAARQKLRIGPKFNLLDYALGAEGWQEAALCTVERWEKYFEERDVKKSLKATLKWD